MPERLVTTNVNPEILRDFFDSRKNAQAYGNVERAPRAIGQMQDAWEKYQSFFSEDDEYFKNIPGQKPTVEYIRNAKVQKGQARVLNLMSPGFALQQARVLIPEGMKGVSVALTSPFDSKQKLHEHSRGHEIIESARVLVKKSERKRPSFKDRVIYGDILQGSVWREISKHGLFDVISLTGKGGFKTFEENEQNTKDKMPKLPQKEIYYVIANRSWQELEQNGVMSLLFNPNYDWGIWVKILKEAGIDVEWDQRQALRLIRHEGNPDKLPRMPNGMVPQPFVAKS